MKRLLARIEDIEMLKRKITAYLLHPGSETVQDSRKRADRIKSCSSVCPCMVGIDANNTLQYHSTMSIESIPRSPGSGGRESSCHGHAH